jgi:hypothetical protein
MFSPLESCIYMYMNFVVHGYVFILMADHAVETSLLQRFVQALQKTNCISCNPIHLGLHAVFYCLARNLPASFIWPFEFTARSSSSHSHVANLQNLFVTRTSTSRIIIETEDVAHLGWPCFSSWNSTPHSIQSYRWETAARSLHPGEYACIGVTMRFFFSPPSHDSLSCTWTSELITDYSFSFTPNEWHPCLARCICAVAVGFDILVIATTENSSQPWINGIVDAAKSHDAQAHAHLGRVEPDSKIPKRNV